MQIGGKHLGIIDDDGVAAAQQRRQIAHDAVLSSAVAPRPHHQKPGAIARRRRPQRDAVRRQDEIKQIGTHSISDPGALQSAYRNLWTAINVTSDRRHPGETRHRRRHLAPALHPRHRRRRTGRARHVSGAAIEPRQGTCLRRSRRSPRRPISSIPAPNCSGASICSGWPRYCGAASSARSGFSTAPSGPALAATLAGIPERIGLGLGRNACSSPIPASTTAIFTISDRLATRADGRHESAAASRPSRICSCPTQRSRAWPKGSRLMPGRGSRLASAPRIPTRIGRTSIGRNLLASCAVALTARSSSSAARSILRVRKISLPKACGAAAVNACDLGLVEAAALLRHADLFVGPSSGPMNLAAAGGTVAFGLFGSTPVLTYSKFIHPIEPPGGWSPEGMQRTLPAQVLEHIAPYLSPQKSRP